MASPDIINASLDIKSYVPPETQKRLKDLEKDLQASTSTDTNFQRVRDQLADLRSKYSNLAGDLDAIEVYLRYLEYQKVKEKKALFEDSQRGFSTLSSRHGHSVSFGEDSTTGSAAVRMPDTTNASVDATGKPTQENGSTIVHGDGDWNRPDVQRKIERGKALLKSMPTTTLQSPDVQSGEILSANIQELKKEFEKTLNVPVTNQELKTRLSESLKEAKTQSDRTLAVQMILEWMRHHNYVILLGEKWYEVHKSDDGGKTFPIQQEFMNIMSTHSLTDADIQNFLIVGSEYFNDFVETYTTLDGKLSKSLDSKEYLRQLRQHYKLSENPTIDEIKKNKDITPRDRDLLLSAAMNTSLASVDVTPQAQSILDMKQQFAYLENINPQYRSILQAAIVGGDLNLGTGTWSSGNNLSTSGQFQWVLNGKTWENYGKDPNGTFSDMMRTSPGSALVSFFIMLFLVKKWTGSWLATLWAAVGLPVLAANGKSVFDDASKFLTGKTLSEWGIQALQEATWDKLQQWFESRFSASNVDQAAIDKKISVKNILLTQNGKTPIDSYQGHLNYLKSDALLSTLRAKDLLLGDSSKSLWSDDARLYMGTPANIDSALLKSMLRHVILWEDSVPSVLNGSLPNMRTAQSGIPTDKLNTWLQKNNLSENDLQNMTVKDLLKKIHA